MHEDNYAAWAWLVLVAIVVSFVAAFDIWATVTKHHTMTGQFRMWLGSEVIGPFIFGAWVGIFGGLSWHWLVRGK